MADEAAAEAVPAEEVCGFEAGPGRDVNPACLGLNFGHQDSEVYMHRF